LKSTPLKRKREEEILAEGVPQSPEFLSPQGPSFIGPTPQRNGIVLGLFDHLPAGTPSKRRAVLAHVEINVLQTPSRKTQEAASETSLESRARGERTPLSAGKRFLFNQFVTPKKQKLDEEGTPSSRQRDFATPSFLRRNNVLSAIDEADEATPRAAPWKRRGLGRSLSAMMQAMKKDEDDRLDEEADIMREMEMEEQGVSVPRKVKIPDIQVEDSQAPMPLGPDRGLESEEDDDEEPELGRDGKPRKVWKKKGLKRQTKRVISRLQRHLLCLEVLTAPQCDQTLQNPNPSRHDNYKISTTESKSYRRHKGLQMYQQTTWTRTQTCPTTPAMFRIRRRSVNCRRRPKSPKKYRKKGRSRLLRGRSRPQHTQTTEDSRSRAARVRKVELQKGSLVDEGRPLRFHTWNAKVMSALCMITRLLDDTHDPFTLLHSSRGWVGGRLVPVEIQIIAIVNTLVAIF
jgi:hypothetical protein